MYTGTDVLRSGQKTSDPGTRRFAVPARDGSEVSVTFTASEQDDPPFGSARNDGRMDDTSKTVTHESSDGDWSDTGAHSVMLGSGACEVRLDYTFQPS